MSSGKYRIAEANRTGFPVNAGNECHKLDINNLSNQNIEFLSQKFDYIVNCSGIIKHKIKNDNVALKVNSWFPKFLAQNANNQSRILQIATDCAFSGTEGKYSELSVRDASDIYGISKINGEVASRNFMNIRCSIIGHETSSKVELLEWVLNSDFGIRINGFTNHFWNGITTLAFAKIIQGIIANNLFFEGTQHLVPFDSISKYELIQLIIKYFNREDLEVFPSPAPNPINRILSTTNSDQNLALWNAAGYSKIPSIEDMIIEYAKWRRYENE